jgi:hypothetical protein
VELLVYHHIAHLIMVAQEVYLVVQVYLEVVVVVEHLQ